MIFSLFHQFDRVIFSSKISGSAGIKIEVPTKKCAGVSGFRSEGSSLAGLRV